MKTFFFFDENERGWRGKLRFCTSGALLDKGVPLFSETTSAPFPRGPPGDAHPYSRTCIRERWPILLSDGLMVSHSGLSENTTLLCDLIYKWLLVLGFPQPQPISPPSLEISHWVLMYYQSRCYHVAREFSFTRSCLF